MFTSIGLHRPLPWARYKRHGAAGSAERDRGATHVLRVPAIRDMTCDCLGRILRNTTCVLSDLLSLTAPYILIGKTCRSAVQRYTDEILVPRATLSSREQVRTTVHALVLGARLKVALPQLVEF